MSELKIILTAVGVAAVIGLGWFVYEQIDQGGYDRCETEHTVATQEAKDEARENVVKVEKNYAPKHKELQETPDSDYGVGPITSRIIDGL